MIWNQQDGRLLTVDHDGRARIRDGRTGAVRYALLPNAFGSSTISYAAWSGDGQQILTVGAEKPSGHTKVNLWNANTYALICTLGDYPIPPTLTTLSPNSRYIFIARQDNKSELWAVNDKPCRLLNNPNSDNTINANDTINAMDWSPDGQWLVVTSDSQAKIWRIQDLMIDTNLDSRSDKNPAAVLVGHTEPIISVDWSRDGKHILTAGKDNTVRIWEVEQRQMERNSSPQLEISIKQLPELRGEWIELHSATWNHNDQLILVDGFEQREGGTSQKDSEKTVRVYYADNLDQVLNLAHRQFPTAQDSDLLDADDKKILAEMAKDTLPELAQEVAYLPDATTEPTQTNAMLAPTALSPTANHSATAFATPSFALSLTSTTAAATPEEPSVVAAGTAVLTPTITLTDAAELTPTMTLIPVPLPTSIDATILPTPEPPTPEPVSTSTPPAASAVPTAPPSSQLLGHTDFVLEARFSRNGTLVASASKDGTARVWRASDGTQLQVLKHDARVNSVAFSPTKNNNTLVTSSDDQNGRIWDANDGRLLATLRHDGRVNNAEFSPDGRWVVTTSRDNTAKIWNANDSNPIPDPICTLPHERQVFTALFSDDSTKLVTAVGDATARIWSISDQVGCSPLTTLQGHTDTVLSARFDADGRRVITASTDGTARIWDAQSGQQLFVLRGHTGWVRRPSFSPSGALALTAGDDGTARLWDANTGALVAVLQHGGAVNAARFSNNGNYISTASEDGVARLWNAGTNQLMAELRGHNDPVISAEFNYDDGWLVTAGLDGSVRLWSVPAIPGQ